MLRKVPDIIVGNSCLLKKNKNFVFLVSDEDKSVYDLYRIQKDEEIDRYVPQRLADFPVLHYNCHEKLEHIDAFLKNNDIRHLIEGNCIVILPEKETEKFTIEAPLYVKKESNYIYTGKKVKKTFSEKASIDEAYNIYITLRKRIIKEEILFDFEKLTLDNGISAFLERYPLPIDLYLKDDPKYYIFDLYFDPNSGEDVYNEYTKSYMIKKNLENNYAIGGNFIIFNKEKIRKMVKKDIISCTFHQEVASIIIGKGGSNLKELAFNLGVKKIMVENPSTPRLSDEAC